MFSMCNGVSVDIRHCSTSVTIMMLLNMHCDSIS